MNSLKMVGPTCEWYELTIMACTGLVAGIEDLDVEEADEQSLERSSGLTGESQRDDAALCFKGHASSV